MLHSKLLDGLKRLSAPFRTWNHHPDGARRQRGLRRPRFESLESRTLLSAVGPGTFAETEEYRDVTGIETSGHIVVFDDSTNDVKGLAKGLGKRHGFNANMI